MAQASQVCTDKNGEQIEFRVISVGGQNVRIEAWHRRHGQIGFAGITKLGEANWQLDEILIDGCVPVRAWNQFHIGSVNFGGKPKTTSYRNRGIGTALMDFLKRYAQQQGVKEIEGVIAHHDNQNTSQLLVWYGRQGFRVILRPPGGKALETRLAWRPGGK